MKYVLAMMVLSSAAQAQVVQTVDPWAPNYRQPDYKPLTEEVSQQELLDNAQGYHPEPVQPVQYPQTPEYWKTGLGEE